MWRPARPAQPTVIRRWSTSSLPTSCSPCAGRGAELLGPDGLLSQVTSAVHERALGEELTQHLGYEKHDPAGRGSGNSRNGRPSKWLLTEVGGIDLDVPRDRADSL